MFGFRKAHSTQHALFKLLTSWQNSLDRGGFVGSILMDLSFSHWTNILKGIPQGSILGPLLFDIFINNLFFFSAKCEICNFADDKCEWFVYNSMKANLDKFQFIILGNTGSHTLKIGDITIKSASYVTLLDITIDSTLNFK